MIARTFSAAAALLLVLSGPAAASRREPVRILIGGDTGHGESYQRGYKAKGGSDILEEKGYDFSLERLRPLLDRADYTILNLETPVTARTSSPLQGKDYYHWTHVDHAPAALVRAGVDAVSLANNHTLDFGEGGLIDSFAALRRYGIGWFGAGMNAEEAAQPLIRSFRVGDRSVMLAVIGSFAVRPEYQKYAFYAGPAKPGANPIDVAAFSKQAAGLRARHPGIFVIAYPHWGANYAWRSAEQQKLGRALIDAGADMVVGHHAHMLQELERYRDKWIVYSLGNFMFNALGRFNSYPEAVPYGLAMELGLTKAGNGVGMTARLYPVLSDNRVTGYQPHLVDAKQADHAFTALLGRSKLGAAEALTRRGRDGAGYFLELPLGTR